MVASRPRRMIAAALRVVIRQAAPFLRALKEMGAPELQVTGQLLGGVLKAAMGAVESGASLASVTKRTLTLVRAAVRSDNSC